MSSINNMDTHIDPKASFHLSEPTSKPPQQASTGFFKGGFNNSTDPEDKVHELPQFPTTFNANRRTSVSAEILNPDKFVNDSWKPPSHKLTASQQERLNTSVAQNFLFNQLDEESLNTVIHALEEKHISKGTHIITQGDEGDFFYVLEKGTVEIVIDGKVFTTDGPGASFGELALMYNSPRAASVIALEECIVWALDRLTFRRILLEGTFKRREMYDEFLKDVPVLSGLSAYERSKLADALHSENYSANDLIVKEGETGENFYLIESGTVEVIKGETTLQKLGKGDYFGEVALLNDLPRQATIKAIDSVKVVTLAKSEFQRLLGPVVEVLKRQDPTHISN